MTEVLRVLIAIVCPPLGVFLRVGVTVHFWVSVLLTLFGYIPGLIHAIWLLAQSSPHQLRLERIERIR